MKRVQTDDLAAWARRHSTAYARLGDDIAAGARRSIPALLRAAISEAPKHTGALRRSLSIRDRRVGDKVELAIHSDDPAAGMQQDGGLLRGRPLMSVPIGVERRYWDSTGTRREARQIPGLFEIRARDGRRFLATRVGRQLVLRFARRRYVRQDGQGWATRAVEAAGPDLTSSVRASIVRSMLATDRIAP